MKALVITGVSGAGKSLAAKTLEDMGYFCVDNMPPSLIPKFIEIAFQSEGRMNSIAFVVDIRGGMFLNDLFPGLDTIKEIGFDYEILFLDASDDVLVNRFKESRRTHPLAPEGRLMQGITQEREKLQIIKDRANSVVDTSNLSPGQLKEELRKMYQQDNEHKGMVVNIISFGYKYGIPLECDLLFDVRFIPNPFYVDTLKELTGKESEVAEYVFKSEQTKVFMDKATDLLDFLIPNYIKEGKAQLIIGIGCTGGKHRSVAIAEALHKILDEKQFSVATDHRDIFRDKRS